MRRTWTAKEEYNLLKFLDNRKAVYKGYDPLVQEAAVLLHRTNESVAQRLKHLNYRETWENFAADYSRNHTIAETAFRVGMSKSGVEKLINRVAKRRNLLLKRCNISELSTLTLMRSANMNSYSLAQFLTRYNGRSQKLFDKKFNCGGAWIHGMLVDDYFDLFEKNPSLCFRSTIKYGRMKDGALLVPWVLLDKSLPEITILREFQQYLLDTTGVEDTIQRLRDLQTKPFVAVTVNFEELKVKTQNAYEAYKRLREHLRTKYSPSHMKNRSLYRSVIKPAF